MEVTVRQSAVKDLKDIDKKWRIKIVDFLEKIEDTDIQKAIKLKGINKDLYRIRFGDYRIIFDYETSSKVSILRILHRQSAYNQVNKL